MIFGKGKRYWNTQKIQSSIFFHIDVERFERNLGDAMIYGQYYYKDAYVCGICGKIVGTWGISGASQHMYEFHPEWIESYMISDMGFENERRKRVIDPIERINTKISALSYLYDNLMLLELGLESLVQISRDDQKTLKDRKRRMYLKKRIYLKPWKDPDSLFCDTKFLEELLSKEITKGNECKNMEM